MPKKRAPSKVLSMDKARKAAEKATSLDGIAEKLNKRLGALDKQRKIIKERHEQAKAFVEQTRDQLNVVAGALNELQVLMRELGIEPQPVEPVEPEAAEEEPEEEETEETEEASDPEE